MNIPPEITSAARNISNWFTSQGVYTWELQDICSINLSTMRAANDSELLKKARAEFEYKTWTHANKTKTYHARLYDAGELGYCILNFKHNAWSNQWFDKAEQIHAS